MEAPHWRTCASFNTGLQVEHEAWPSFGRLEPLGSKASEPPPAEHPAARAHDRRHGSGSLRAGLDFRLGYCQAAYVLAEPLCSGEHARVTKRAALRHVGEGPFHVERRRPHWPSFQSPRITGPAPHGRLMPSPPWARSAVTMFRRLYMPEGFRRKRLHGTSAIPPNQAAERARHAGLGDLPGPTALRHASLGTGPTGSQSSERVADLP